MGQVGRPRQPTASLKLRGTFRTDRRSVAEPEPTVIIPDMPKFLKGEARREWNRITVLLAARHCLTEWDRSMLAAYCNEWAMYVYLSRQCYKAEHAVEPTRANNSMLSGKLLARKMALKNCMAIATEFGLTPSSRSRIKTESDKQESDPFESLMNRRKQIG
jgi:P27 family predicted phage terminase small subunit